jgi:hypothetical protein
VVQLPLQCRLPHEEPEFMVASAGFGMAPEGFGVVPLEVAS